MSEYQTKGSFNLGNQIIVKNKNSNIDRDYGPYEGMELDEIAELLKGTIQVGKTIGVIEEGEIKEYWWQFAGYDENDTPQYEFIPKNTGDSNVEQYHISLFKIPTNLVVRIDNLPEIHQELPKLSDMSEVTDILDEAGIEYEIK